MTKAFVSRKSDKKKFIHIIISNGASQHCNNRPNSTDVSCTIAISNKQSYS